MATQKLTGSAKARKSSARMSAVQVLYQMRLNHQDARTALKDYVAHRAGKKIDGDQLVTPDAEMLDVIVKGVEERWTDIDGIIAQTMTDGGRDKVEILLDCILRAGIYELLAHGEIATGIIINDYLSVTAGFYEGAETRIINGILDKAAKVIRA